MAELPTRRRRRRRGRPSQPPAWGARRRGVGIGSPTFQRRRTLPSPFGAGRTRASAPPPVTDALRVAPGFTGGISQRDPMRPGVIARTQGLDPNDFLRRAYSGPRDPVAHQESWQRLGWNYDPRTRSFTQRTGAPPPVTDTNAPPPVGAPPGSLPGMPLDPMFEQGRRFLDDELASVLGTIPGTRAQILASQGLAEARLGTNESEDQDNLRQIMAARGIFGSGIQRENEGELGTDYLRQRQDLATNVGTSLADLARYEAEARGNYSRGLQELLMQSAANSAMSPYTPTPNPGTGAPRPPARKPGAVWVSPRALRRRRAGLPPIRRR